MRDEIKQLKEKIMTFIDEAETMIDDCMGEWAGVTYEYLPENQEPLWEARENVQLAREAVTELMSLLEGNNE